MKYRQLLLLPVMLFLALQTAIGQGGITDKINADQDRAPNVVSLEREAEKATAEGDYYKAMVFYRRALEYDSLRMPALERYGDVSMQFAAYGQAEMAYQRLVGRKMITSDGLQLVKLADAKFRLGKYTEAKELYRRFLYVETPVGITQEVLEYAQTGLENCDWALAVVDNSDLQSTLDTLKEANTDYAEFAAYPKGDTVYYASYRFEFEKDKKFPKRRLAKTLIGIPQPGDTLKSSLADFNVDNRHTANVTFNEKGDVMYFTICDFIGTTARIRCEIYMRKLTGGTWSEPVKLPPHINIPADSITTTEPSIGRAPGDSTEILYFMSNRPGGKGKYDIWYSRVNGETFSPPANFPLNTKENDVTPFYHNGTGTLYFSTDGLQTIGGLDIYRVKGRGDSWDEPVHMGMPINSPAHDAYFSVNKKGKVAFLASNRKGSRQFQPDEKGEIPGEQSCCYDLYRASIEKPEMIAITFNKATGDSLSETTMQLVEYTSKGVAMEELKVKVPGTYFSFPLQPRRSYQLIASKPRFLPDTLRFETPPTIWKDTLIKKLYLTPATPHLVVTVYDKETGEPIPGVAVDFHVLGKMLPGGTFATGKGGGPLESSSKVNELSNRFDYDLDFEHRYQVAAFKKGYTRDSSDQISTINMPDAGIIEKKLYLTRGVTFAAHTLNRVTRDTLYGVTYRLVEIEGGNRREEFVNPPGITNYETTLNYDRQYLVIASKDGYTSDTVRFSTKDLPRTSFQHITRELQLRPLTLQAYLPIRLYFDNDEPDKRSNKTTTEREYRPTYVDFYRRKPEFLEKFSEGLDTIAKKAAVDSVDLFFERDVRGGWERLFFFSEDLYKMMERGDYIVLTLRGFASPRAGTQYNMNLTARRVNSVRNHFLKHDGGIYKRFVDNGQIVIKLEPNGENLAPKDISDDVKDLRRSIYDPRASRERRLEIIGVEVKRGTNGI